MLRNYQFPSLRFLYKSIFIDKQIRNKDKDRIKFRLLREKIYIFQEMTSHLIIGVSKIFFLNSSMLFVLIFVKLGHVEKPDQKLFSIPEWYIAIDTLNMNKALQVTQVELEREVPRLLIEHREMRATSLNARCVGKDAYV